MNKCNGQMLVGVVILFIVLVSCTVSFLLIQNIFDCFTWILVARPLVMMGRGEDRYQLCGGA